MTVVSLHTNAAPYWECQECEAGWMLITVEAARAHARSWMHNVIVHPFTWAWWVR